MIPLRCSALRFPLTATFGSLVVAAMVVATAAADPVEDFYRGKTVTMLSANAPGGGYDARARQFARYMGKYIPGNPTLVVQNMPGASGKIMANHFANLSAKDGTVIGMPTNGIALAQAMQDPAVRYDVTKFNWIGSMAPEVGTFAVWHSSGAKTFEDLKKKEYVAGGSNPSAVTSTFPAMLNKVFGTKIKVISGYVTSPSINLAMERGEVEARYNYWSSWKETTADALKTGKIIIVVQTNRKAKDLPNVPSLNELTKDEGDLQLISLLTAREEFGYPVSMPSEVPADRVRAIRNAFEATLRDPEFIKEMATAKADIDPVTGDELSGIATRAVNTPAAVKERAKEFIGDGG